MREDSGDASGVMSSVVTWLCGGLHRHRGHTGCTCSVLNCRRCPGPQTAAEAKRALNRLITRIHRCESPSGPDRAAPTHTGRAVVALWVVEVTLSVGAAEPLQLGPQPAPQQAVVVRKVHQRVVVHLVA